MLKSLYNRGWNIYEKKLGAYAIQTYYQNLLFINFL